MRVHCRTNLDLHGEAWPSELPAVPNIGDRIQSATVWRDNFQLQLKVVSITWKFGNLERKPGEWVPEIELQDGWPEPRSTKEFFEWYAPFVGRSVSAFI